MAPRFQEVSKPVEAGVQWATSVQSEFSSKIRRLLPTNVSATIIEAAHNLTNKVPDIKFFSDLKSGAWGVVDLFPQPTKEVKYLLVAALVILVLRSAFVCMRSRSILSNYGAAKVIAKEL